MERRKRLVAGFLAGEGEYVKNSGKRKKKTLISLTRGK